MSRVVIGIILVGSMLISAQAFAQENRTILQERLTAAEQRAERAEQTLQIREMADELERAQTEQAYNRFEVWVGALVGFFSVLITILVVIFGFRTARVAATEAATAAQREVSSAKGDIDALSHQARMASEAARKDAATAQDLLADARREIEVLSEKARAATASAEDSARQAIEEVEKVKLGVQALSQASERMAIEAGEVGKSQISLTAEQAAAVTAGAEATPEKSEAKLSVDEFKVQIGKASYVDNNYEEALRLASLMESYHPSDDVAVSFSLRHQADALRLLGRLNRAFGVYSDLIERFSGNANPEITSDVIWSRHHRALLLDQMSRHAEAEIEFRTVIPLAEEFYGPRDENTLTTHFFLALSVLNQGRGVEAETGFRKLLSLAKPFGSNHALTLGLRHGIARALSMQGRTSEAEETLRALLPVIRNMFGDEHQNTRSARYNLARALLDQGRTADAETELRELLEIDERLDGAMSSGTLVTRYSLADAVLQRGRASEAQQILDPIPEVPSNSDWLDRWQASLAFVRGRVADALGRPEEASVWLAQAETRISAIFPPEAWDRKLIERYIAHRDTGAAAKN